MPGPSLWSPDRRALTTGLVLTTTLVASESLAVSTIMPVLAEELHGIALWGWVFAGFFLGNLVGIVIAGRAIDRLGPVRPFAIGLVLFSIGLLLGGLAPSMPILVAARILQGIGAGFEPPVAYVAAGRAYPDALRPRLFYWLSIAWVVPGIAGPAVAAAVAAALGWRWVFLGLLPFVVLAGGLTLRALIGARLAPSADPVDREHAPAATARRLVLAIRLAVGAGLLVGVLALDPGRIGSLTFELGLAVIGGGAIIGLLLGVPALRRLTPDGTLRAAPGLPAAILLRGVLTFAFFGADAYVPLLLVTVRGAEVVMGGLALTAATITWTLGSWVQQRVILRIGARPLIAAGFAVVAIGTAGLYPVLSPDVPLELAFLTFGFAGLGMGFAYSPLSIVMLRLVTPGAEGSASSALSLTDVLGTALGTGLAGALVAIAVTAGAGESAGLAAVYGVAIVTALLGLALTRRLP